MDKFDNAGKCAILLPKDLAAPHNTAVLRFLISKQNRVFPKIKNFMFDKYNTF